MPSWPIVRHSPGVCSLSTTAATMISFSNTHPSTDLSRRLLPRSSSLTSLGQTSSISTTSSIPLTTLFNSIPPNSSINAQQIKNWRAFSTIISASSRAEEHSAKSERCEKGHERSRRPCFQSVSLLLALLCFANWSLFSFSQLVWISFFLFFSPRARCFGVGFPSFFPHCHSLSICSRLDVMPVVRELSKRKCARSTGELVRGLLFRVINMRISINVFKKQLGFFDAM